jgi:hypothetical protein
LFDWFIGLVSRVLTPTAVRAMDAVVLTDALTAGTTTLAAVLDGPVVCVLLRHFA